LTHRGRGTVIGINRALDNWATTWDQRKYRDTDVGNMAFCLDPMPLWWLAKLFLILHCGASVISDGSEFARVRVKGTGILEKIALQAKIFGWLSKFRSSTSAASPEWEGCGLATLMKPITED